MFRTITAVSLTFLLVFVTVNAFGAEKTYNLKTVDFPNATATSITGISDRGDIVGSYTDSNKKTHGFLLSDGVFTTIDVREAGNTMARGINARGITFLLIEHNIDMVTRLCHRVLVMASGQLLSEGTAEEVARDPRVIEAYLGGTA